jgi:poly(3-hydroxybutyrate) depolymerase
MQKHLLISTLLAGVFACGCSNMKHCHKSVPQTGQHPHRMSRQVTAEIDYLLYLPDDYGSKEKWPLIIFLHGAGERGSDLNKVTLHGPPKLVEEGQEFPFIIASPQCPDNAWWPYLSVQVNVLIDDIIENYRVDENRVYLTGLSMGGYGTWAIAGMNPERFAAIAPICGGGERFLAHNLKNVLGVPRRQGPGRWPAAVAGNGGCGEPGRRKRQTDGLSGSRT